MAATKYTFSIQSAFPHHVVNTVRLEQEIQASSITVALDRIETAGDACDVWFKAALSEGEQTTLQGLVAAHSGEALPDTVQPRVSEFQRLEVEVYKAAGKGAIICSHNFCDPCSWWSSAVQVENRVLEPVDDGRTLYVSGRKHWIDLFHGRVTREGTFNTPYRVILKVNGVTKTEGVDFIVHYRYGEVSFSWINPFIGDCSYGQSPPPPRMGMGPLAANDVVTASFYYANGSTFTIKPASDKIIRIEKTEVQHTQDVLIHSSIVFQPWMPNPYVPGTMMPVPNAYGGEMAVYKAASDFVNEGNQGVGSIRGFGGGSPQGMTQRGLRHDVSVYPFDYLKSKDLDGSKGVELRIWCLNDVPLDGEFGTVTCYCTVEDA